MSYDIRLKDEEGDTVDTDLHQSGANYAVGGSKKAVTNITYNYSWFYYQLIHPDEGIRWLDGRKAKNCIATLKNAHDQLGTNTWTGEDGYWAPSPGNAGAALEPLIKWAEEHPEAEFEAW